ncbi:hypothetical protein SBOR_9149 [Sclerotinia borealis F-4128]|uniref:Uncharacterized protein n=1 Tax=Sclerotinia borealis (strain F-4128) TaxID=1432307 RepID=W9C7C0_SCLBF|nr:hypothetical protein SBOR_9149 [Sclerotinia borealis F-4128]
MEPARTSRGTFERGQGQRRDRGCGYPNRGVNISQASVPVPRFSELLPGTHVSIVLKVDQGSGREVQGWVGNLLGRGEHPRGVKVRLRDGRVGRVRRIVKEGEVEDDVEGLEGLQGLGENGEVGGSEGRGGEMGRARGSGFLDRRYTDFRNDGYDESTAISNTTGASLEDYIVVKGNRKGKKERTQGNSAKEKEKEEIGEMDEAEEYSRENARDEILGEREEVFRSEMSTCFVCAEFEGDELAMTHHVNGHFE